MLLEDLIVFNVVIVALGRVVAGRASGVKLGG